MYYTEEIQLNQAASLFAKCGLSLPTGVDYTAGVFHQDGTLAATGSLKGDMIQGIAVDPGHQGEDLTAKVLTHLIGVAKDAQTLYLFTKPEKTMQFTGLGFRLAAKARPYAALLEWGQNGVGQYGDKLREIRKAHSSDSTNTGALVMNCNPFTLGHRYLIEEAARQCEHVYVLVVEEDLSVFSFADRLRLVEEGTKDLDNVTVLSGGRYAVSTLTFPSYFTKEEKVADAHAAIDAELFAEVIAPALGVTKRFVGTEPLSVVTNIYNQTLKSRLPKHGIEVVEIERLALGDEPVSASRVRDLIDRGGDASWDEIRKLVSDVTFDYLWNNCHKVTLTELLDAREKRAAKQKNLLEIYDGILMSVTLNIPGPVKDRPAYRHLLEQAMNCLRKKLGAEAVRYQDIHHGHTGSEGYLCICDGEIDGAALKRLAVEMEEEDEKGRLFDIDVITKEGSISRRQLGLPPRKCLLCGEEAKVCARGQRHKMDELLKRIEEIISEESR